MSERNEDKDESVESRRQVSWNNQVLIDFNMKFLRSLKHPDDSVIAIEVLTETISCCRDRCFDLIMTAFQ